MCKILGNTKQALYKREKHVKKCYIEESVVVEKVKSIKLKLPKTGGRKINYMLNRRGIYIGRDKLFRILGEHSLLVKRRRSYKPKTTESRHRFKKYKNLYKDTLVQEPEQVFVSDITYIRVKEDFSYLSLVTDAYSKKIMGACLRLDLSRKGTLEALTRAIDNKIYNRPLMHHSDRGLQYSCDDYVQKCKDNEIIISMTESGSPYDNAIAERVNGILKSELGLDRVFDSFEEAEKTVSTAVRRYNKLRPHMSCGYLTPEQAHKNKKPLKKLWQKKFYAQSCAKFAPSDEAEAGSAGEQLARNNPTDWNGQGHSTECPFIEINPFQEFMPNKTQSTEGGYLKKLIFKVNTNF
jgi:putative transposase